jgi:RHS repeat-associated protein
VNDLWVKKTVDGSIENYYLDGDNIAFVTDGVGDRIFHYLYGLEADQVLAQDSETGMVWSLADRLGSIDVLTNEQGVIVDQRTYDSFGNTLSQLDPTVKFRFGYTGRESDPETGLYYYRARYFDANVGRFISTDPIGFEAGDANLYRYVNNSSTLLTDPSGKIANVIGGGILGGFFGGLYALANDIETGRLNENTFERVVNGATVGAVAGAIIGSGIGLVAGLAGLAVTATGLVAGAGFTGWGIGSGIYNIANGKPLTGTLDLIGGAAGLKGLQFGYKGYKDTVFNENIDKLAKDTRATISSIEDWQTSLNNGPRNSTTNINTNLTRSSNTYQSEYPPEHIQNWLEGYRHEGHKFANSITEGGTRRSIVGHGILDFENTSHSNIMMEVPNGSSISFYTKPNKKLPDYIGRFIEAGDYDTIRMLLNSGTDEEVKLLTGAHTKLPGSKVYNYTLQRPSKLNIYEDSMTVKNNSHLSDLIYENMGNSEWAACTEFKWCDRIVSWK